jgi:tRNA (mo5U34)-methyltransferase
MLCGKEAPMQTPSPSAARAPAIPPAPPGFSAESAFAGFDWEQRWEIFQGVFVPGSASVESRCQYAGLPTDLSGKRVLDVGAGQGYLSFECERRGAREVVALGPEDPASTGFDRLKELLGSRVRYVQGTAYTLSAQELGTFDVVLLFSVLVKLRYPLLALDRIRAVTRGEVFVQTHVIDDGDWLRGPWRFLARLPGVRSAWRGTPVWRQYREFELHPQDQSNWFGPNIVAVVEAFRSAGFDIALTRRFGDQAFFRGKSCSLPFRLLEHSYESFPANRDVVGWRPTGSVRRAS